MNTSRWTFLSGCSTNRQWWQNSTTLHNHYHHHRQQCQLITLMLHCYINHDKLFKELRSIFKSVLQSILYLFGRFWYFSLYTSLIVEGRKMLKRKGTYGKPKGMRTEVPIPSNTQSGHLYRNWQHVHHWVRLDAISPSVINRAQEGSRGSQPESLLVPTDSRLFVTDFMYLCHVLLCPLLGLRHSESGTENITFFGRRWLGIRSTWPSHRSLLC